MKELLKFISWYRACGGTYNITPSVFVELLMTKFKNYD